MGMSRTSLWVTLSFLLTSIGAIIFISPWGNFPLNDDWVYTKNVLNSLKNGHFSIAYSQHAWAIPQVFLGQWLVEKTGDPFLSLRWVGIFSGVLAALFTGWLCARAAGLSNPLIVWTGAMATYFYLPFLQPSFSFMSDLPAFLFWNLSMFTVAYSLEKQEKVWWLIAFLIFLVALAERQVALLIPISVLCFRDIPRKTRVGFLLFCVPFILIQSWWSTVAQIGTPDLGLSPNLGLFVRWSRHLLYLGWLAVPFLFYPLKKLEESKNRRFFIWSFVVFLAGLLGHIVTSISKDQEVFLPIFGNVISNQGILTNLMPGSAPIIFSIGLRGVLTALGFLGMIRILYGFALMMTEKHLSLLVRVIFFSSAIYFVFVGIRALQFDRYAIPLIPLVLVCLLKSVGNQSSTRWCRVMSCLLLVPYCVFSMTLMHDYFRWNEARWATINLAYQKGIAPSEIGAGYEYYGWTDGSPKWLEPKSFNYVVSFSELAGFNTIASLPYKSLWGEKTRQMYLLKNQAP